MRIYIPKGKTNYYVDFGRGPGQRMSTGTSDPDEAQLIADEMARKVRLAKFGLLPPESDQLTPERIPLSKFADKYVQFLTVTFPESPKTAKGARTAFPTPRPDGIHRR